MHVDNEGEALTTQHIVLDDPDDQVYVTYQGVTISISLAQQAPELTFFPRAIEVDLMTEDDLDLTYPGVDHATNTMRPGDGVRITTNGEVLERLDRSYRKGV